MKKNTPKKAPKKIKHQKKKLYKKSIAIVVGLLILFLLAAVIASFYGKEIDSVTKDIKHIATIDIDKKANDENIITFEEKTKALEIEYIANINDKLDKANLNELKTKKEVFNFDEADFELVPEIQKDVEDIIFVDDEEKKENIKTADDELKATIINKDYNNPKLAIIIDDMTTQKQINNVKALPYIVNMSFLPPTKGHKNSAKITNNLDKYMIHLPLQASNFMFEEENTLHITDSMEIIEDRIKSLRTLYTNTNYLNNHTGSKFTASNEAMDKLFQMLKKYNYIFLDSRTTANSVAKKYADKYKVKMFTRNIFLDNNKDKIYIQNQLKKAIKIAKKTGLAIAIGHPYSITFETLKDSTHLLEGLDLVFIQDL